MVTISFYKELSVNFLLIFEFALETLPMQRSMICLIKYKEKVTA